MKEYQFHFIPNTHWDREWLYDFQETRLFLVEFLDKLLDLLTNHPEYKSYLLDSQTIPIEDYLAVRPERAEALREQVKAKRLLIGPWYTLPEEHLVNGESLVRNLLIGHQIADAYGGVMKVGYSPFSYGQASQMPQIYQGFGIDTILFYHGITPDESRSEFIFEGADGSQLFASRMGSFARYNFFFNVYRPLIYGKKIQQRDYQWTEGGLPFHLCGEAHYQDHHFLLDPVQQFHEDRLAELMAQFKKIESEHAASSHIACMQGMDSTQPDVLEIDTVAKADQVLKGDRIFHSSLQEWIEAARAAIPREKLTVLKGERRTPRNLGTRVHLYGDVTSARTSLKRKNALAEIELQRKAEPFAVLAHLTGAEYPLSSLTMAWKYLLQCHPHDSIAGTGVDQIEKDMHYRLDQSRNISAAVARRALQALQMQIDHSGVKNDEVVLTVFNPSPYPRSEVVSAVVDVPLKNLRGQYGIYDAVTGEALAFQEQCRYEHPAVVRHLGDATMEMQVLRCHLHLPLAEVPALGYRSFIVRPQNSIERKDGSLCTAANVMENAHLVVKINGDGTLDITHKESRQTFKGLHYFEDAGEAGHAWRHVPPAFDRVLTTLGSSARIERLQSGPYLSQYAVTHVLHVPEHLVEGKGDYVRRLDAEGDDAGRSEQTAAVSIRCVLTLRQSDRGVEVQTMVHNTCRDHRLRVLFPTLLAGAIHSCAEEPYDVVERPIDRGPESPWRATWNPTHPHQRFVDVSDGQTGLAILNDGLREYEVSDDAARTIALTLLRAFGVSLTTVAWRWERHPEMNLSQMPGVHTFRYYIYPHSGDWDRGQVMPQAERFVIGLEVAQAGPHAGRLPQTMSFFNLDPVDLQLSAVKRPEDGQGVLVRIYNPTGRDLQGKLICHQPPLRVTRTTLEEKPADDPALKWSGKEIAFAAGAKKIITLKIEFAG